MNTSWTKTLVAGAAIGTMAVAAVTMIDRGDAPRSRSAGAEAGVVPPTTVVAPTTVVPATTTVPGAPVGGAPGSVVRTVTVAGEGTVTVKPDTARLDLGVSVTADTAKKALDGAADRATTLTTSLRATGVADDDIRTSGLSLYPSYDSAGQRITGYNASNNVTVTIRSIDETGSIIDAAAGFVGDAITIGGISFSVDDDAGPLADARAAAMADAALRAGQYSAAAGATVGQVLTISEETTSPPQVYDVKAASADASVGATSVQPGTQELTVRVTVTYELS